jgi:hypothetical protein
MPNVPRGWRPTAEAADNVTVQVRTVGGHFFPAYRAWISDEDGEMLVWHAAHEGRHPRCWTDGICWASNEDLQPSDPVVGWRPIDA